MPRLTERDRLLMGFLAMARYLTSKQIARLVFPGRADSTVSERLNTLAEANDPTAYLRRLSFRTYEGKVVVVWTLSKIGYHVAVGVLGAELKVPRQDIGADFLEHSITASQLFVFLAQKQSRTEPAELPTTFRWFSSEGQGYPFGDYDVTHGKKRDRLLQPDAVLEVPRERRRFFIELETGTHSITSSNDEKAGSTLAKAARYEKFINSLTDLTAKQTWYAQSFPDGLHAEVLFVVTSPQRRDNVNQALDDWRKSRVGHSFPIRALTLSDASHHLRALIGAPRRITEERAFPRPLEAREPALLTHDDLQILVSCHREFFDIVHRQHELHRSLIKAGKIPQFVFESYPASLTAANDVLEDLYRRLVSRASEHCGADRHGS